MQNEEEEELPIMEYRDEIIEQIQNNPVVIITGETGCGKVNYINLNLKKS
jgi:HrpA-like RNA helicase